MRKQIFANRLGTTKLAQLLDEIAKYFLFGIMLLIVINILLRVLLNSPIIGSYDLVSLFTVAVISFALANCAIEKGHVAVEIIVDRFPVKVQKLIDIIMHIISIIFIVLFTYHIGKYAYAATIAGDESMTLRIPHYPFIYIVFLGYLSLSMVLLNFLFKLIKDVLRR